MCHVQQIAPGKYYIISDFVSNNVKNPVNTISGKLIFKICRGSMLPDYHRKLAPSALGCASPSAPSPVFQDLLRH